MDRGVGVSIVSRQPPEELVYVRLVGIALELQFGSDSQRISARVDDIQVDNQLYNSQCPVLLYVNPMTSKREGTSDMQPQPAIVVAAERVTSPNINAEIFKVHTARTKIVMISFMFYVLESHVKFLIAVLNCCDYSPLLEYRGITPT